MKILDKYSNMLNQCICIMHMFFFKKKNLFNVQKVNQQGVFTCLYDIFVLDFYLLPGPLITTVRNTNNRKTRFMCDKSKVLHPAHAGFCSQLIKENHQFTLTVRLNWSLLCPAEPFVAVIFALLSFLRVDFVGDPLPSLLPQFGRARRVWFGR